MKQKYTILILLVTIILVLFGIIFILIPKISLSPTSSDLVECNTLSFSSKDAINILFFTDNKTSEEYMSEFVKVSPIKENKDKFNFYFIDKYIPKCELYKGIATLCYSKKLIRTSGSCPNDYIVVIDKNKSKPIRSSSYLNVLSINRKHQLGVLHHEFGHSFVKLAEEYTPAEIPKASKNCVSSCSEFNGLEDGCFKDCSDTSHYRSIERGIMKTLKSKNYGSFNSLLISDKIKSLTGNTKYNPSPLSANVIFNQKKCSDKKYTLLTISPDFKIKNKEIFSGCVTGIGTGSLNYSIFDSNGKILQKDNFDLKVFTDIQLDSELTGEVINYDSEFYLPIPLINNVDKIVLTNEEGKLISTNLQNLNSYPCRK